ncbi:hypothetical protein HGO97_004425 [Faecalicatena sp. AGMB00832]|uniref:Uncharacterized protein n=1 Tax=Faecalicatena faecalis TaxID=2726362 RepID=A0ABS6D0E4_9FIRM|nr:MULTISPECIES: hypothetical protein [Faecalicatena]MBU3875057.1 hypothetical protein [Faecalicatena faecalis]MCI6466114.1 hypothetical protein [Faecalicatena sp.]MDY5619277.1 hypothetical protein [Lachnospiraceae bacterium]
MSERKIKIQSGKEMARIEVPEEEYQKYYRRWQQKKAEQRNRETMEEDMDKF